MSVPLAKSTDAHERFVDAVMPVESTSDHVMLTVVAVSRSTGIRDWNSPKVMCDSASYRKQVVKPSSA